MPLLNWDDRLLVGVEPMDQTHREFVELLGELGRAAQAGSDADADAFAALERLIEHTVLHFRQEEEWMVDSGWGPPCHAGEHHQVLEIIRTVRTRALAGEWKLVGVLVNELGPWFEHHASTMDSALVAHMANVGYQPQALVAPLAGAVPA